MSVPASFIRDGFLPPEQWKGFRRLMLGSDGLSDTGKTEFALSAPGPTMVLALDRGYEGMLDTASAPKTRITEYGMKVIRVPLASSANQKEFLLMWKEFYAEYIKALANLDCRTVVLDGDSDSWELQRLAEFGKLTQIPSIMYVGVNAARRVMIARAYDAGKNVIATNKCSKEYETVMEKNTAGVMVEKSIPTGDLKRQGFADQDYGYQVQIRHMYKRPEWNERLKKELPGRFGLKIMKCKPNMDLIGMELWGSDCNFAGLVQTIYPDLPLSTWGYK